MINNKSIKIEAFKNILKEGLISHLNEAEYKGKDVELNKPFRTPDGPKKFAVYVKNKKGNVIIVRFGDPNMEIKRDDPKRRKAYRARHKGDKIHDKTKAGYWSWKFWGNKSVSDLLKEDIDLNEIDVYHGSDRKFDVFDMNKIGSGDGKSLGGWGLYFSDSKDVSDRYKTNNGFIKPYEIPDGEYFNLDEELDETISSIIVKKLIKKDISPEDIEQFRNDYQPYQVTNKQAYDWLSYVLNGEKNASLLIKDLGYIGNMFKDKWDRDATNYVLFDTNGIEERSEDDDEMLDMYENKQYIKSDNVYYLPIDIVDNFRSQTQSNINFDLENDIEKNGITTPITLIYHVHDKKLAISDGHHRLDIANYLNIDEVPVMIQTSGTDAPINAKTISKEVDWKGKEYLSPKDLGLNEINENETLKGGLSDNMSLKDIALKHNVDFKTLYKEYLMGLNVEREHTSDIDKIIEIVKDHLFEKPDYYSELKRLDLEESFINTSKDLYYHGTPYEFDKLKIDENGAIWLTTFLDIAKGFAFNPNSKNYNILKVKVSDGNYFDYDNEDDIDNLIDSLAKYRIENKRKDDSRTYEDFKNLLSYNYKEDFKSGDWWHFEKAIGDWVKLFKRFGYDGVFMKEKGKRTLAVFNLNKLEIVGKLDNINESVTSNPNLYNALFKEYPNLSNIGSIEQYQQYAESIFPNSKVPTLVKGLRNKSTLVHNVPNHFWFSDSPKMAEHYRDNRGLKYFRFDINTVDNFKSNIKPLSPKLREDESNFINNSNADCIILDTADLGGKQLQYVIKKGTKAFELGTEKDQENFKRFVDNNNNKGGLNESNLNDNLDIKKMYGWYPNFKDRYYNNIDAAKNEIERIVSHENKQHGGVFGFDNPKDIINLYNYVETNKGVKIEPKLKQPNEKKPELEYLTDKFLAREQIGLYTDFYGLEIGRNMSNLKYIDTNDSKIYGTEKQDEQKILKLMKKLKNGEELPPILLDYDYGILDGHHRWEAAKRLKIKKIPVIIYENPNEI